MVATQVKLEADRFELYTIAPTDLRRNVELAKQRSISCFGSFITKLGP